MGDESKMAGFGDEAAGHAERRAVHVDGDWVKNHSKLL